MFHIISVNAYIINDALSKNLALQTYDDALGSDSYGTAKQDYLDYYFCGCDLCGELREFVCRKLYTLRIQGLLCCGALLACRNVRRLSSCCACCLCIVYCAMLFDKICSEIFTAL